MDCILLSSATLYSDVFVKLDEKLVTKFDYMWKNDLELNLRDFRIQLLNDFSREFV